MTGTLQRTVTGLIFIAIVIGGIMFDAITYAILMLVITSLLTQEVLSVACGEHSPIMWVIIHVANLSLFAVSFLTFFINLDIRWFFLPLMVLWVVFLYQLFSKTSQNPVKKLSVACLSLLYVGVPVSCFNLLVFHGGEYNFVPLLCFFCLAWINDTGAYIVGISIGKTKLFQRVSPKKTVEGFAGGVAFTFIASVAIHYITGDKLSFCIIVALIVALFGTVGDLIESMMKRNAQMKDSGKLLPGHGGMLDRFDSIIFASPIVALAYYLLL